MDRFEYMVTEVKRVDLVTHLEYALLLQFTDRLEKCGKIFIYKKSELKNMLEYENGEPRAGNVP